MALGAANTAAIIYFITNVLVLLYNLDKVDYKPKGYSFLGWLTITILLTVLFRKIHLKLSRIDPDRDNFDFSE